jgi:hypothetical protein
MDVPSRPYSALSREAGAGSRKKTRQNNKIEHDRVVMLWAEPPYNEGFLTHEAIFQQTAA